MSQPNSTRTSVASLISVLADLIMPAAVVISFVLVGILLRDLDTRQEMIVVLNYERLTQLYMAETVLRDMPSVVSDKRVGEDRDRLESRGDEYRRRVGTRFREVFAARPAVCRRVDAEGSIEEVAARIWEVVRDLLD